MCHRQSWFTSLFVLFVFYVILQLQLLFFFKLFIFTSFGIVPWTPATGMMDLRVVLVNAFLLLTNVTKDSFLDVSGVLGSP